MKIEEQKYWVFCPMCQNKVFHARSADLTYSCPKCKTRLKIFIEPGTVQVQEDGTEYDAMSTDIKAI